MTLPVKCIKCKLPVCGSWCTDYPGRIAVLTGYPGKPGPNTQSCETQQRNPSINGGIIMGATTIIEGKRYDLSKLYAISGAKTRENHGVSREGVWVTKSGKVIVETYSIWQRDNTGCCIGQQFHFADTDEIARLADELQDEKLLALVPVAEDA